MCTVKEIREAIREDCRSQRNMETIEIDRIFQTLTFPQLRNMKQYLLTVLFNAPTTMSNHYTSQVNHDMYGGF